MQLLKADDRQCETGGTDIKRGILLRNDNARKHTTKKVYTSNDANEP